MSDPIDFLPLFAETMDRIRARMDADAIGTLDPSDPSYPDTREGSFYWDMTQVSGLEAARLWDAFTEVVAAAFPSVAWGEYLDEHGLTFNIARNPAIASTGTVLFTSDISGVAVAANTQVASIPSDPTQDAVTFQTAATGVTSTLLNVPSGVVVTPSLTGGSLVANTYFYHVTAYSAFGETVGSPDAAGVIASGVTGENAVTWSPVSGAVGYRIYRTLTAGMLGNLIGDVVGLAFTDDGSVSPDLGEPTFNSTAGVRLPVLCTTPGAAGNLAANGISQLETPIADVVAIANEQPTVGGQDTEDDEAFRKRLLAQYQGTGGGSINDYVRWSLAFGAERVYVAPIWDGAGTVLVVPMLSDGTPCASTLVNGLQDYLDPIAGMGHGQAPIGAQVTVQSTTGVTIAVSASVTCVTGFSVTGSGGTIAVQTAIESALQDYLLTLNPGDVADYGGVQSAFFVEGVSSVTGLLVNGGTSSVPLSINPSQTAQLGTLSLA